MQRAWLDFVAAAASDEPRARGAECSDDWPCYEVPRRATRVIKSMRDVVVDDPDHARREAWTGIY
jgi:para-nitrobenzyl esterase